MFAWSRSLTTGVDQGAAFKGGAGDDTFVASNTTLTILDNIDGGAGTDTLAYTDASNTAFTLSTGTVTIAGIENFTVTHSADAAAATDAVTMDMSTLADARNVVIQNVGSDADVTVTAKANLTSVTVTGGASTSDVGIVTVADSGTTGTATVASTDKLATITLTGLTGVGTLSSEALTTLNLNAAAGLVTNTDAYVAATDLRTLTVNHAGGTNGGALDAGATTAIVNVTGATTAAGTNTFAAATTFDLNTTAALTAGTFVVAAATDVNVNLGGKVTASTLTAAVAKTLDISGTADATITQTAAADAVITNTGSGALTLVTDIAAGQKFVGGSGVDTVSFAATGTTASSLGAGADVAKFAAVAGTGGVVDGGDGLDTVSLTAALAVSLSANANFEDDIASFEKLTVEAYAASTGNAAADNTTISLANLDDINYVTVAGAAAATNAQTFTISGFATAGTYEQTALIAANVTQALTGSFTGASDTFNLRAAAANGFVNAGVLTLANVESIAITTDDTDTTAATAMFDLNLDAVNATSITVVGDAGITFANSSYTALRTLDASGVTATGAAGVVTFTANAADTTAIGGAGNDVLTGGAANDILTGNAGTDTLDGAAGNDTISGGDGVDTITGGTGADTLTGGAGNDIFVFATGAGASAAVGDSAATADTITDFSVTDVLRFIAADNVAGASPIAGTVATSDVQIAAGGKVTFAAADDTLAKKLVALAADDTDIANSEVVFFEDSGNTYIYGAGAATATAADDYLVKLAGVTGRTTLLESTTTAGDFTLFIA